MKTLTTLVFAALLAAGCGGKKDGAIANDDDYLKAAKDNAKKGIDIFKADGKDCDKLADDMDKFRQQADTQAIEAYEKAHPDAKKKFDDASKDMMKDFEAAAGPAIEACKDNKKLQDVMSKM